MSKLTRFATLLSLPLLGFSLAACSDPPSHVEPAMPAQAGAPAVEQPPVPTPRTRSAECIAPSAVSNPPRTVDEAITLINALPKPLTLPCFLQALARPLAMTATDSVFSLQPADGLRSPRIFLFTPGMVMSVVALLNENANPTDHEIREALEGNICRCTGYQGIVDAVKIAAERVAAGAQPELLANL